MGGVSLTLKPNTSVDFLRLNMLSPDGACKSFDASGNGYCRSEGAVTIYLTKRSVAKRIYAHVVNSKNNSDGYKTQGKDQMFGAYEYFFQINCTLTISVCQSTLSCYSKNVKAN